MIDSSHPIIASIIQNEQNDTHLNNFKINFSTKVEFNQDYPEILHHHPTLLQVAAFYGNTHYFTYMMNNGGDINVADDLNIPVSCFAAASGSVEILQILHQSNSPLKDFMNRTILHYAAQFGKLSVFQWAIEEDIFQVNCQDQADATPLHVAIDNHQNNIIEYILSLPNVDISLQDHHLWTPLHCAARYITDSEILSLILSQSEDLINTQDNTDWTPLHRAAFEGNTEFIRQAITIPNIDVNAIDNDDITPVFLAGKQAHFEAFKLLLEVPEIIVSSLDRHHRSILHYLSDFSDHQCLSYFLENHVTAQESTDDDDMININQLDDHGRTPLMNSITKKRLDLVNDLCSFEGIDVNIQDNDRMSALHYAVMSDFPEGLRVLLNQKDIDVNVRNSNNETPLHLAARKNNFFIASILIEDPNIDLTWRNLNGRLASDLTTDPQIKDLFH